MKVYWTKKDRDDLKKAVTFSDLLPIAITIINKIPKPVTMVSGPISTGGFGSPEKNMEFFSQSVKKLYESGARVFDQTPFNKIMTKMKKRIWHKPEYCMPLLEEFYFPLFRDGYIQEVYFLPDWQSSFGARWEHDQCQKLNILIKDYPTELLNELIKT